jgi:serine/threonine protein kinase
MVDLFDEITEIFPGSVIAGENGNYSIESVLGSGAQGVTLLLERDGLQYAGKFVEVSLAIAHHKRAGRGALRGAGITSRLDHPGIPSPVETIDAGSRRTVFVREYAPGRSLRDILDQSGRLSEEETLDILGKVGSVLSYAHSKGVIHRDIKPDNIIIDEEGAVRLIDFDTAKDGIGNTTMTSVGTFNYQAPEQTVGTATAASDVYALGVTGIECVVGNVPQGIIEANAFGGSLYTLEDGIVSEKMSRALEVMVHPLAENRPQKIEDALARFTEDTTLERRVSTAVSFGDEEIVTHGLDMEEYGNFLMIEDAYRDGLPSFGKFLGRVIMGSTTSVVSGLILAAGFSGVYTVLSSATFYSFGTLALLSGGYVLNSAQSLASELYGKLKIVEGAKAVIDNLTSTGRGATREEAEIVARLDPSILKPLEEDPSSSSVEVSDRDFSKDDDIAQEQLGAWEGINRRLGDSSISGGLGLTEGQRKLWKRIIKG